MTHPFNAYFELSDWLLTMEDQKDDAFTSLYIANYDDARDELDENSNDFPTYPLSHPSFKLIPYETLKEALKRSDYDSHNPTLTIVGFFVAKNKENLSLLKEDLDQVKEALSQQDLLTLAESYLIYCNPSVRPDIAPFYSIRPPKNTLITFINTLLSLVENSNEKKAFIKAKLSLLTNN